MMRCAMLISCYLFIQILALPRGPKTVERRQPWWWSNWWSDGPSDNGPDIDVGIDGAGTDIDIEIDIDFGDSGDWPNQQKTHSRPSTPQESTSIPTPPTKTSTITRPTAYIRPTKPPANSHSNSPNDPPPNPTYSTHTTVPSYTASQAPSGSNQLGSLGKCSSSSDGIISPGVDGKPSRSMIDSINYIRQYWDSSHPCMGWSDSLASYAQQVVQSSGDEGYMRPVSPGSNIAVIWGGGYGGNYVDDDYATTLFEQSLYVMLCEDKADPKLGGSCPDSTGPQLNMDNGCDAQPPPSLSKCIGHYAIIVDQQHQWSYMGCYAASNGFSCEFSSAP